MRRLCAIVLMLASVCEPILAAAGPLERSLSREAARLASEPAAQPDWPGWKAVHTLEPGAHIVITTADTLITGDFVSLDGSAVSVGKDGVVQRIAVDDIQMIERRRRHGSALAASLATVAGLWLGSGLAIGIGSEVRCQPHCGGVELAMMGMVIGVPIAAGYGAWRGTSRMVEEVIYRRIATVQP